jgi:NAD(P)H-dependent FMN reductase
MKVAILLGAIRKGRQSDKVARCLQNKLEERGIEADLIDLLEHPLPLFQDWSGYPPEIEATIKNTSNRLNQADALLFVTPEYHGSFSGVLKNALEFFWAEFDKKPIGVATVSSGRMGGINALNQLQHVILSLGAYPIPQKFLVTEVQNAFDESGNPLNDTMTTRANKFLDAFLWFADAVYQKNRQTAMEEKAA